MLAALVLLFLAMVRRGQWPRLAQRTLGGRWWWRDVAWQQGWRVQQHVVTGHGRLLDPGHVRRAWGYVTTLRTALVEQAPTPPGGLLVVCLHGLGRHAGMFQPLAADLVRSGAAVMAVTMPTTHDSVPVLAVQVGKLMDQIHGYNRVAFVTHSLGGLVVRELLAQPCPWRQRLPVAAVVQCFPPNQGSRLGHLAWAWTPLRWLLGPALRAVQPAAQRPPLDSAVSWLVIAGTRSLHPLLPAPSDGVVTVAETVMPGVRQVLLPVGHTRGLAAPRLRGEVLKELRMRHSFMDRRPPGLHDRACPLSTSRRPVGAPSPLRVARPMT